MGSARSASNVNDWSCNNIDNLVLEDRHSFSKTNLDELPLRELPDDELRDPEERLRDLELRELPLLD